MNVIYKEQIDDEIESLYSTRGWGRKVYKIIHWTTSMIELWLNIASFDPSTTSIWKKVSVNSPRFDFRLLCKQIKVKGREIASFDTLERK